MSKIRIVFEGHVEDLRETAREKAISFIDLLLLMMKRKAPSTGSRVLNALLAVDEATLIANYRLEFFERAANDAIEEVNKAWKLRAARKRGGEMRAKHLMQRKADKATQILTAEKQLKACGIRLSNKAIAKKCGLEPEYVRKERAKLPKKKRMVAS